LDPWLGAIAYGAELTQLGAIGYDAEVRAALAQMDVVASTWHRARRHRFWRRACLAQSVEHKALNLMVVGLSPMMGVFLILFVFFTDLFFCCPDFSLMSLNGKVN
jgi:hypothetical protein